MTLLDDKTRMRTEAVAARKSARTAKPDAAEQLAGLWPEQLPVEPGCIIAGFHPIGTEIDPRPLLRALAQRGAVTALPVMQGAGRPLIFRRWFSGDPLEERAFGVSEPVETALRVRPDLVLVPLLAFDALGYRLGYGAGFYDRTLAKLREDAPVTAIGIAYAGQEVDRVPVGEFDIALDWMLTEDGARDLSR